MLEYLAFQLKFHFTATFPINYVMWVEKRERESQSRNGWKNKCRTVKENVFFSTNYYNKRVTLLRYNNYLS